MPLVFSGREIGKFISIPINIHKFHLSKVSCALLFKKKRHPHLNFQFIYGVDKPDAYRGHDTLQ